MSKHNQVAKYILVRICVLLLMCFLVFLGFKWIKKVYYVNKFDLTSKEYSLIHKIISTQEKITGYNATLEGQVYQKDEEISFNFTYIVRDGETVVQNMDTKTDDMSELQGYLQQINDIMTLSNNDMYRTTLQLISEEKMIMEMREGDSEQGHYEIENYIYYNDDNQIIGQKLHLIWKSNKGSTVTEWVQCNIDNVVY